MRKEDQGPLQSENGIEIKDKLGMPQFLLRRMMLHIEEKTRWIIEGMEMDMVATKM